MDMLDMKFEADTFQIVLDKGSFDAVCSDLKSETQLMVQKYLAEVTRVLSHSQDSGFFCISLLQDFVLKAFLKFFTENETFSFTIKV
jgi:hypothetical protein